MATRPRANTDAVHAQMRADILSGAYPPGERLKFAELCERYAASVAVVRESLTRLVEQGLARSEPRIGFRVTPLSVADLLDLTATRCDIEGLALRYSIERGDVEWESRLVAAHHVLERTPLLAEDGPARVSDEWEAAHTAFHAALIDACQSPRMLDMTATLRDASELYRRWSQPLERGRDVAAEHRGLLDAALSRDADLAVARLREHFEHTARILEGSLAATDAAT
ncbi:FCD domain-containing protein [Nocardioides rotundus]|uniref:GntR family transcriptional regulator n=1 Tax=Nocardioides rotundus TaxID=1774216 RepID=UPI001CBBA2AA|nr:FCD domain-containing protein [Nocardioides rotundus]UAL29710.1 FCD domain-containing protein [Nocardioides rotundus]